MRKKIKPYRTEPTAPMQGGNQPIGFVNSSENSLANLPYPNVPPPYPATNYPSTNPSYLPHSQQNQTQFQPNLPYPHTNQPYSQPNQAYPQPNQTYQQPNHPYAPNAAYPPMNQNVYTTQPGPNTIIIQEQKLTSEPITTQCPNCKEIVTTNVEYKAGKRTHGAALLLCALDADCCALLPYCCDQAKDAHHTCPKCKHYFGKHEPSL